jgi:hypothetical protein
MADGRSGSVRQCLRHHAPVPTRAAPGVAMPAGHRSSSLALGGRGLQEQRFRAGVRPRAHELACPRALASPTSVHPGGRRARGGWTSIRAIARAADTSIATDTSPVTCAGHQSSGQRSSGRGPCGSSGRSIRRPVRLVSTWGLTTRWNSGPIEGRVNQINMLKRQMFGRASLPLLRKRVLLTASR